MKIEKIELNGFKSFADRTVFNLHDGITCIVGPNGCGKSNIVDAFRWVLGEQSAKTLRGGKMEEVIFSGSEAKKAKGMADVTLHISGINPSRDGNGDGTSNTVTVSRRLYRSGDSEYMINRHTCRLKDIRELFLDTGLEVKSYSIIEQGHIDAILKSKPEDRRFLIEEVAGVVKYKVRKAEAQNKLESSRLNLQRINDVIAEVKKQINTLNRLARKAERYKALSEELKEIELKISRQEYLQLREALERAEADYREAREAESSLRAALSTEEAEHQKQKIEAVELEKALNRLNEEFQAVERSVADIQKDIAVLHSEADNARRHAGRLTDRIAELEERNRELHSRVSALKEEREALNSQFNDFRRSVSEKTDYISGMEERIAGIEEAIEEKRKEIFRTTETLSSLNNDLTRLQSVLDTMDRKEEGHARETEEIAGRTAAVERQIADTDALILARNNELSATRDRRQAMKKEAEETEGRIEAAQNSIASLKEELASDVSRLESLREISSEGLTGELVDSGDRLSLAGILADVITVDSRYEKALESVLADRINGIILPSTSEVERAALIIREKALSRTALILDRKTEVDQSVPPADEAVIGRAVEFISSSAEYSTVVENLLANVVIVRDLKSAFRLAGSHRNIIFVTPEGDILDRTNTVLTGRGKDILKKKREIRELEKTIEEKQQKTAREEEKLNEMKASLESLERGIEELNDKEVSLEKEVSLQKLELQKLHQEKERLQRKKATINIEMEQTRREKENLQRSMDTLKENIAGTSTRRERMEKELAGLQQELAAEKEHYEQYRSDLTEIKVEMTSYREKMEAVSKEIQSMEDMITENRERVAALEREKEETAALIEEKTSRAGELDERLKGQILHIDGIRASISAKREETERMTLSLNEKEEKIRSLRERIDGITARLSASEVARTEHRLRMENIFSSTVQKYGVNIDQHEAPPPSEEEMGRVEELREKIAAMGPVNLGTIEEFEELNQRYEFLTSQQEDLTKSIEELEEAIRKINLTTRKKLREAFNTLNEKFSEVFTHLFGGGRAELVLTDDQNILESGIDIIAQPPGKKLQNISLLSGGEKALTAISLIFAGFLIKPAPICILDEADAPLDESNAGKFAALVRELARETQFVVITHNRTTMETADHIYGITMEEPGVSKVVSMQLAGT